MKRYTVPLNLDLGHGNFRETLIYLDGQLGGATWQLPVIYTGGVVPHWWEPVVGIGAFVIPTYFADISPLVPLLLQSGDHNISFKINDIAPGGTWSLAGALHLWTGGNLKVKSGTVLVAKVTPLWQYFQVVTHKVWILFFFYTNLLSFDFH